MHMPDSSAFAAAARDYEFVPVHRRLLSDWLTPVSAFELLDDGGPAALFESVVGGEKVGRFSLLAIEPVLRYAARGDQVEIEDLVTGSRQSLEVADPLDHFRGYLQHRAAAFEGLPPFTGGAVGYAGYDVVRYVERLPDAPPDDRGLPDFDFALYHTVIAFDNVTKTMTVVALVRPADHETPEAAYRQACRRIDQVVERLSRPPRSMSMADVGGQPQTALQIASNFTRESFAAAVRKCIEYIRAGDIFQVVPSQRFRVRSAAAPLEVYRSLRVVNPSPFMFFLRTPDCELIGCSPEIMCRVVDRTVTVRPLAGTRRRGATEAEDEALERELLADPKERAEHVMLVDLGRNDVGRVARFGSIELTEVMVVERYSHVMHISSEVRGALREGVDAFDALKACLPAGTVSGAPKVRAMEIIDEVEPHRRGPYAGAVGYIDYRGNMDTCIALRTMVAREGGFDVQAGCGVVADSDPAAEYDETVNKARGLIRAIEVTHARLGL
jgi:anthranilate synthase component 1